jgi:prevent-host-death family protein
LAASKFSTHAESRRDSLDVCPFLVELYKMTRKNDRKVMTAAEAKSQFAECLRTVDKGNVVVITRYGKAVAALVGPEDLVQLDGLKARVPEEGLIGLVGRWRDSGELSDALDKVIEGRSKGRLAPQLG